SPLLIALPFLLILGLLPAVMALYGAWRRLLTWLAASTTLCVLVSVTVYALPLALIANLGLIVDAIRTVRRGRPARSNWLAAIAFFVAMNALSAGLRAYVIEAFGIPSSGMCPTVQIGDHLYVDKLSLRWRAPARGDVIVFVNADGRDFIE